MDIISKFASGEGLMATALLYSIKPNRATVDFSYGIAPIPKYSTDQAEYRTYALPLRKSSIMCALSYINVKANILQDIIYN